MRLPWELRLAEKQLAVYEATHGADHPEVARLRRCIEACRRKYAKLPRVKSLFIDHVAGIYPNFLWEQEELGLFSAFVFFWPDVQQLPESYQRAVNQLLHSEILGVDAPKGPGH